MNSKLIPLAFILLTMFSGMSCQYSSSYYFRNFSSDTIFVTIKTKPGRELNTGQYQAGYLKFRKNISEKKDYRTDAHLFTGSAEVNFPAAAEIQFMLLPYTMVFAGINIISFADTILLTGKSLQRAVFYNYEKMRLSYRDKESGKTGIFRFRSKGPGRPYKFFYDILMNTNTSTEWQ